ncbi:MAG: hypothetical protein OSA40_04555 [Phycisphaerales bacterium]|nr:hypothetical protein [Phycisphaerales bacterium]
MLTIRRFLKTLIGVATPTQIMLACLLGSLLGFLPIAGPGLIPAILVVFLLLMLNANIFLAGLVAAGTKLLSIAAAPLSFWIGRVLIDGPTEPIARALANGPVTAWMGFESYFAVGGLVLGVVIGVLLGLLVGRSVIRLRRTLAALETDQEAVKAIASRRSTRFAAWILFGGIPKGGFRAIADRHGSPIRISGIVIVAILVGFLAWGTWSFSGEAARGMLQSQLTQLNGSTVDVGAVEVRWIDGRAEIRDLQICDTANLDRNLLQAAKITVDLDLADVLRRRLSVNLVQVSDAMSDAARSTPGVVYLDPNVDPDVATEAESTPEGDVEHGETLPGGRLESYLQNAAEWRERLKQISRGIDELAARIPEQTENGEPNADGPADGPGSPSFEAWLREQIDLHGYAGVRATHLIDETPTFLVRRIEALGVRSTPDPAAAPLTYDIVLESLSTQPLLVEEPPSCSFVSSDDSINLAIRLGRLSSAPTENQFDFTVRRMEAGRIVNQLVSTDPPPFSGGTIDAEMAGVFTLRPKVQIAAPLDVVLRDTTISIGGEQATIRELPVRIDILGRLDDPSILIDEVRLADALKAAGADLLAARAQEEADKQIGRGLKKLEEETGITLPDGLQKGLGEVIGGGLGDLFGGSKDD